MGAISNLARETERLPAITREQLAVIQQFNPPLTMRDITKPHEALWEFRCERSVPPHHTVYVWLSEEGRVIATAWEEYEGGAIRLRPGDYPRNIGKAVKRLDWTNWLNFGHEYEELSDKYGLHSLGTSLHEQIRQWAIDQVINRMYERGADYYGRVWEGIEPDRFCPVCGQPKAQPCDHNKLSNKEVQDLRKSTQETA
jgi:hypothetical protein